MGLLMIGTRTLTGYGAALAAALSLGAPLASAQKVGADTVYISEETREPLPCPVPDVLAEHELALGCAEDVPAFLARLKADTACGSQDKYSVDDACAVIIYSLDPQFVGKQQLPPTMTVRIGKVTGGATAAETVITVIKNNGVEERFGPDRLYELLIPIRIDERVVRNSDAGLGRKPDQKVGLFAQGIRYYPALMVGRGEASKAMTPQAAKVHFTMPRQVGQNMDRLTSVDCQRYWRCF